MKDSKNKEGFSIPLGKAAKKLGISTKTLIRHAPSIGLSFVWDGRGRRVKLSELNEVMEKGFVEKDEEDISSDIYLSLEKDSSVFFDIVKEEYERTRDVYKRFRGKAQINLVQLAVYRIDPSVVHCGRIAYTDEHYQRDIEVEEIIRDRFGGGLYLLKLIYDSRMSNINFTSSIAGNPKGPLRKKKKK